MSNGPKRRMKRKVKKGNFSKQKYTNTRVKKDRSGNGILSRVKDAFSKKGKTTAVAPSIASSGGSSSGSGSLSVEEFKAKYPNSRLHEVMANIKNPPPKTPIVDPGLRIIGPGAQGTTIPTGKTILDDIASGVGSLTSTKGTYNEGVFSNDPLGESYLQYTDASGNVPPSHNPLKSTETIKQNIAFKNVSGKEKKGTKDPFGNTVMNMDRIIYDAAAKRGINKQTDEFVQFKQKMAGDINQFLNARTAYDRSYDFQAGLGTVGPGGNIPQGYTFGGKGTKGYDESKDLQHLDIEGGGTGKAYSRINDALISRKGRYVPDSPGSTNYNWQAAADAGSTDNYPDIPIEAHYWANPELGTEATALMPINKGKPYKKLDEDSRESILKSVRTNQEAQFYSSSLHKNLKKNYPELSYDYTAVDPWVVQTDSKVSPNFSIYK